MLDQDDDFVSICDFARHYYREYKWQIMPLSPRSKIPPKDFPAIDLQKGLLDEESFEKMWGKNGAFISNHNCGVLCGAPSSGLFVVDLDTEKEGSKAQAWWDNLHAMRPHPETPTQITGSGGTQIFFKMPEGMKAFNHKNAYLNVDFQGEGAYVVLPPSIHPNGKTYRWVDGMSPDDCDIITLPDYLIEEIREIIGHNGEAHTGAARVRTDTPQHQVDSWGKVVDGREDLMTRIVFKHVVAFYRDCPIIPPQAEQDEAQKVAFNDYLDHVEARLHESGMGKEELLEKEGRGVTLFSHKWRAAIKRWDDKISREAARPFEKVKPEKIDPFAAPPPESGSKQEETSQESEDTSEKAKKKPEGDFEQPKKKPLLKLYTIDELEAFGPVKALIQDTVAEGSLGFIYGPPGCGKMFVALSMGLSIAYGFDHWFWGKKIERHGPVVYISLEGKADLGNRLKAWKAYHNISHNDQRFRAIIEQVNFTREESVKLFVDSLDDYMAAHEPPAMIFIDTVSRAIAGGGENDTDAISLFIETCGGLQRRYATNLTGIHHTGRLGTNMRGSSAFDGGADFMYRVERDKKSGLSGLIHAEKIKAYPDAWEQPFRLVKMDLDAFGSQTSLVATSDPEPASAASAGASGDGGFGGAQETGFTTIGRKLPDAVWKAIFDEVDQAKQEGIPWSEFKQSGSRYAGTRILEIIWGHGITTMNESDADMIVRKLTGKLYLVSVEYMHNKMYKKGLEVRNRPLLNV